MLNIISNVVLNNFLQVVVEFRKLMQFNFFRGNGNGDGNDDNSAESSKKKRNQSMTKDEDWFECSICTNICESTGKHTLVSLGCGHLFGDECIRM